MNNYNLFSVFCLPAEKERGSECQTLRFSIFSCTQGVTTQRRANRKLKSLSQIILTVPHYTIILNQRVRSFAIVKIFKTVEASYFDLI